MATKTKELTQTGNIKTTDEMVIWDGVHTLRTPSVALAQVLSAGNLKMPDSEETIAEQTELPLKTVQQLKENQVSVPAL